MKANLVLEIDLKKIKKFSAMAEIELTAEEEAKLVDSTTILSTDEINETLGDENAILAFAGIIISKQIDR